MYKQLFGEPTRSGHAVAEDGTRLIWDVFGKKSKTWPAIVCVNGIGCTTYFWHYLAKYFSQWTEVVTWDYRGHGRNGKVMDENRIGMEDNADDLEAVLADADIKRAVLIGHSMGSQVSLEYFRRHPARVAGLVPLLGTYGDPISSFFDSSIPARAFPYMYLVATSFPAPIQALMRLSAKSSLTLPMASMTGMVNGTMIKKNDLLPYLDHLSKVDVRFFMKMTRRMGAHTTEDLLPHIDVPVLIIGGEKDIYTPVRCSEKMYHMIPDSEMIMLPGGSHAAIVEQPELINLRLEKFIRDRVLARGRKKPSAAAQILEESSDQRAHER